MQTGLQLLRFSGLSALSFVLLLGTTTLLVDGFGLAPKLSYAVALVIVFIANFQLLCGFVFKGIATDRRRALALFALSTLGFRSVEWVCYAVIVDIIGVQYQLAVVCVVPLFAVLKFVFLKRYAFATLKANAPSSGSKGST